MRQLLSYDRIKQDLEEIEGFAYDWSLDTEAMKRRHPDLFFPWEVIGKNVSHPEINDPY